MKIKKSILKKIIREEAGRLSEGCPASLPCPHAAAQELVASGASHQEMLDWVATLMHDLLEPGAEAPAGADGATVALDAPGDGFEPMGIALENRSSRHAKRAGRVPKLSSRQIRGILESVVGPGDLIKKPGSPTLPKGKRSSTLRKRRK
jgi:hypothetical protein